MSSLYDVMELKSNCTSSDLAKQFKILTYKYRLEGKNDELVKLNTAFQILNDQHMRKYYDFYGNSQIETLKKPLEGYLYSRYFTRFNIFLIILASILSLTNLSCLYYFFIFLKSNTERFLLLIISPFIISITMINSFEAIVAHKNILRPFIITSTYVGMTMPEIYLIACYYDGLIPLLPAIMTIAVLEAFLITYYYVNNKEYIRNYDSSGLTFCVVKAFLMFFFFVDFYDLGMFAPTLIAFSYSVVEKKIALVFGIAYICL